MEKTKLIVGGMSCAHCEHSIKKALLENKGIVSVEVSLSQKVVSVEYSDLSITPLKIRQIIEEIGYDVL
ncbi:MAG: heavy-metal-associated domain-containing protein [Erysipelothrix sp.]|jgi:copper chaperone|nr:heavy-metal-associated domain-containing protein [Erysipelothrix sp.]